MCCAPEKCQALEADDESSQQEGMGGDARSESYVKQRGFLFPPAV